MRSDAAQAAREQAEAEFVQQVEDEREPTPAEVARLARTLDDIEREAALGGEPE